MGRFFYYRYRHVVLHTVVDHRLSLNVGVVFPKHYIIWLLISVLLAVKAFAFSPVEDGIAVRQLLFTLLATALIVPYFKRSSRVKATFVNP
ncbi:inner membrane protein YdgK [Escherichia coli]|uniref:Inner membrane protein YdgK n=1 Tax=Escherichia coli TaxID=562 RepID=A0A2X3JH98_ECOLX|nr:inner membrane protein YdgK [Escherichia coli]